MSRRNRQPVSKLRRSELGERVAVYLPPELATELRLLCARERRSLSDAVTDATSEWIRRREREWPTHWTERVRDAVRVELTEGLLEIARRGKR